MSSVRRLQALGLALLALQLPALEPGAPLSWGAIALVVLSGLKLLEARRPSELRRTSLLLLLATGVLAAQLPGLGPSLLQLLTALVALSALLAQELGHGLIGRELLGRSLKLMAAALPLVLVLFLLLPRLGPVFTLPFSQSARTGLSDRIEPGAIASLMAVDAPAVRIGFASAQPPAEADRYWRVLVLNRFDGARWQRDGESPPPSVPGQDVLETPGAGGGRDQLWLVEPTKLPLLPWSGRGLPLESGLRIDADGELLNNRPPSERRGYAIGATDRPAVWQSSPPAAAERQAALAYIPGRNPRLEALGRQWARDLPPEQRPAAARDWFLAQSFRYTLQPGTLPAEAPLDAFLFETRSGFCEHYAAAFAALMRAADVPVRLVAGYQGGDWVPQLGGGGYLDVRQSDAHAWSEVWLDGQGWQRVDPTAWVAPARINPAPVATTAAGQPAPVGPLVWLQQQWRGLDLRWTGWILGFNRQAQAALLERLLGARRDWLGALVLAGVALSLALVLPLLRWGRNRNGSDPLRAELERCLRRLRRLGHEPEPGEDLGRFLARVGEQDPPLASTLARFSHLYLSQRFGPPAPARLQRQARRQLRQLCPRGRPPRARGPKPC